MTLCQYLRFELFITVQAIFWNLMKKKYQQKGQNGLITMYYYSDLRLDHHSLNNYISKFSSFSAKILMLRVHCLLPLDDQNNVDK